MIIPMENLVGAQAGNFLKQILKSKKYAESYSISLEIKEKLK